MTTSTRMNNFKRMAERFSREGKLISSSDKGLKRQNPFEEIISENAASLYQLQSHLVRLVLNPSRKAISH